MKEVIWKTSQNSQINIFAEVSFLIKLQAGNLRLWIRQRPNFDEFSRHFHVLFRCNFADRNIHLVSTYFFRPNFAGRKIHAVSTYFFRRNFDGRTINVVSTYFFRCNFSGRNIHVVSNYFFQGNFDGQKLTSLLVTSKLMKTFGEAFLCL